MRRRETRRLAAWGAPEPALASFAEAWRQLVRALDSDAPAGSRTPRGRRASCWGVIEAKLSSSP